MNAGRTPPELRDLVPIPTFLGQRQGLVHPINGVDPWGRPVAAPLSERRTLLLFVSTTCDGCRDLWAAFGGAASPLPVGVDALVITRGPAVEAPTEVAALAGGAAVVMDDTAWANYEVHSGPFFVLVDGVSGRVLTEGVAWSVAQIRGAVEAVAAD